MKDKERTLQDKKFQLYLYKKGVTRMNIIDKTSKINCKSCRSIGSATFIVVDVYLELSNSVQVKRQERYNPLRTHVKPITPTIQDFRHLK